MDNELKIYKFDGDTDNECHQCKKVFTLQLLIDQITDCTLFITEKNC